MVKTTCDRVGLASAISFGHWPACCENNKALSLRMLFSLGVHASLYAGRSHYIIGWQLRPTHTHRLMREHGCWWSESYHDIYTISLLKSLIEFVLKPQSSTQSDCCIAQIIEMTLYAILAQAVQLELEGNVLVSTFMLLRHPPSLHSVLSLHWIGMAVPLGQLTFIVVQSFA